LRRPGDGVPIDGMCGETACPRPCSSVTRPCEAHDRAGARVVRSMVMLRIAEAASCRAHARKRPAIGDPPHPPAGMTVACSYSTGQAPAGTGSSMRRQDSGVWQRQLACSGSVSGHPAAPALTPPGFQVTNCNWWWSSTPYRYRCLGVGMEHGLTARQPVVSYG
jgi:hypothetical protein